jgi:hypothetical protein
MATGRATLGHAIIDFHPEALCRTDYSPSREDQHVHIQYCGQEFFYRNNESITENHVDIRRQMEVEINTRFHKMRWFKSGNFPEELCDALTEAGVLKDRDAVIEDIGILARDNPRYALPEHQGAYTGVKGYDAAAR